MSLDFSASVAIACDIPKSRSFALWGQCLWHLPCCKIQEWSLYAYIEVVVCGEMCSNIVWTESSDVRS